MGGIVHRAFKIIFLPAVCVGLLLVWGCSSTPGEAESETEQTAREKRLLVFNGGPTGGTFNFFANKMAQIISHDVDWMDISARSSGGSADNLRALHNKDADMGIVYAGDGFLGRNGNLPGDVIRYDDVRSLAPLYGAPAQLIVQANSEIKTISDLSGKRIAIGNPGSGAALSAQRFFQATGLWDTLSVERVGYADAVQHFIDGKVDAFWVLVGAPNASVFLASTSGPIRLLDTHKAAEESGFYEIYPFYTRTEIPPWTYDGQSTPVVTFQDWSMWCVRGNLDNESVETALQAVFSEKGIADMMAAHPTAQTMTTDNGVVGLSIPLHPGAVQFWKEQDATIPLKLLP